MRVKYECAACDAVNEITAHVFGEIKTVTCFCCNTGATVKVAAEVSRVVRCNDNHVFTIPHSGYPELEQCMNCSFYRWNPV